MKKKSEVIEMHATWLTINSVIGCTNGCKYCFLQSVNKNITEPIELVKPKEAVRQLLNSKYYNTTIPICLLPNTDAFLNDSNTKYLKELLLELDKKKVFNPISIITKCEIKDEFIDLVKELKSKGHNIVIYLSYSGLGKKYEPNVNPNAIRNNFKKLYNAGIDVIHYFRPLIPANSSREKIDEMLDFTSKYTKATVITGLKVRKDFVEKIDFWDAVKKDYDKSLNSECIWPKEAYEYIYGKLNKKDKIYQTNSCALALSLNKPCTAYYNTTECKKCNLCPKHQRKLCLDSYKDRDNLDILDKLNRELIKIGKKVDMDNIKILENEIMINSEELTIGDLAYLTVTLGIKVAIKIRNNDELYWNSSLAGAKPLIM